LSFQLLPADVGIAINEKRVTREESGKQKIRSSILEAILARTTKSKISSIGKRTVNFECDLGEIKVIEKLQNILELLD